MERIIPTLPQNILMTTITYSAQTNPIPMASMSVDKVLSNSRFPVYLTNSTDKKYVLKVFPFDGEEPSEYYRTEALIAKLNHPNIVRIPQTIDEKLSIKNGRVQKISMILMEYEPNGDLHDLIANHRFPLDDKLARTYFQQLVHALEFLHSNGIAHLDLKPENILLDRHFNLKLIDFELAYFDGDEEIVSMGTQYYRPPEIINQICRNPYAADIFSLGIILFILKTGGLLPQTEDIPFRNVNLWDLMQTNPKRYFEIQAENLNETPDFFSEEFRELFLGMTKANPNERWTIEDIKKSKWYTGPRYSQSELKMVISNLL